MRLEPLLTLEIREKIRRAVSELNDIEAILESMGDSASYNVIHKGVLYSQESLIERLEHATKRLLDSLLYMKHLQLRENADYSIWMEDLARLNKP